MKNILIITPIKHLTNVFERAKELGNIIYKPYIDSNELKKYLLENKEIEYIFTNPNKQGFILGKENLEDTNIRVINTASTGTNHIDKKYCKEKNIDIWSLTKDYELINDLPSTSELGFGLMLSLLRYIPQSFNSVKKYEWDYERFVGRQVKGLSLGIIGFGRLGKIMANFGYSFGMKVLIYDPYVEIIDDKYFKVELDELCKKSDVISLHVHVTNETRKIVNKTFLENMKDNSYLINTSRGEIVDEEEIINFLKSKKLSGYGTDVIYNEFDDINNSKLIELAKKDQYNLIITPHIGGMSIEGQNKAFMYAMNKFK
jgi:D-3-phosphoglycerate dehydrogenase